MALREETIQSLAAKVDEAARTTTPLVMLTAEIPELTLEEAYTIQRASMARRFERGETLVGMKMGLTSRAKMEQMGVHEPIYGHLTSAMTLPDGATITHGDYCHPRVEPEIAFLMGENLSGTPTPQEALRAVSGVCGALEIIDSRYKDFKFTLIDVVADNASSTGYVLGTKLRHPATLELGNLGMVMSVNGQVVETGSSAAILEHPARSLAALVKMLHARGEGLKKGQVVLAGGATKAVALNPGDQVTLEVEGLGRVALGVE